MKKKNILFVTSEAVPFIKTGGLADVAGTLPKYFNKKEFDVRVILPKYACMKEDLKTTLEYKFNTTVNLAWRNQYVGVLEAKIDNITFYFIDNEFYFSSETPYGEVRGDIEKFAYFCRAVLTVLPMLDFCPHIIHCHDWQSALIPVYLFDEFKKQDFYKNIKTVLTIHNLKFQGIYSREIVEDVLGLSFEYFLSGIIEAHGDVNLLKSGLMLCDRITTVSNTYSEEIKTDFYGEGLDSLICMRQDVLSGIVNGIDYESFNPENDKCIFKTFSKDDFILGKRENKLALQKELNLPQDENIFMLGIVSRLTDQKGFDLIDCVLDEICQEQLQLVVLGTGEKKYENMFAYFAQKYPNKVAVRLCYSEELSHKIYASCDAFLMPSLFEPCGLSQLMSLRYGTLPIVRQTGGLKDTVISFNKEASLSTGFSFENYNAHDMLFTLKDAEKLYYSHKNTWNEIVARAMSADFSWNASAMEYEKLYRELV